MLGDWGLLERIRGEEKVLVGRGRTGVCTVKSETELEEEEEEMTEAFLLRSARVGTCWGLASGEG